MLVIEEDFKNLIKGIYKKEVIFKGDLESIFFKISNIIRMFIMISIRDFSFYNKGKEKK